jgi:3-oxoacyl-[acyl-carrier-protein] synthase-3
MFNPGTHANHWTPEPVADFNKAEAGDMFMSHAMIDKAQNFPNMDGPSVFKKAVVKFPEVIMEALTANGLHPSDIGMLIPHQANLRIAQFVQQKLGLSNDQVYNNIDKYGIQPHLLYLCSAERENKRRGAFFGCFWQRFTGGALLRW